MPSFGDVRYRGGYLGARRLPSHNEPAARGLRGPPPRERPTLRCAATCPSASPIRASLQSGSTGTTSMPETPASDDHRSIAALAASLA